MQIPFFVAKIWSGESKNLILYVISFEHGYLSNPSKYCHEILYEYSSNPFLGKHVSDCLFMP